MTYQELYINYRKLAKDLEKEESAIKLLISHFSGYDKTDLYLHYDREVPFEVLAQLVTAIDDYLYRNKAVQYLIGYTYFYNLKLKVDESVLIPRPETEELVDLILSDLSLSRKYKILDIGSGSGAISLALKANLPKANVLGVDISLDAINIAKQNMEESNLEVRFIQSDLFSNVKGKFDVIISNPPYISRSDEIDPLVKMNEPHLALFAEFDGLYFYNQILKEAHDYLNDQFMIAFEIPEGKDDELLEIVDLYYNGSAVEIKKDLNNLSRFLIIKHKWR